MSVKNIQGRVRTNTFSVGQYYAKTLPIKKDVSSKSYILNDFRLKELKLELELRLFQNEL